MRNVCPAFQRQGSTGESGGLVGKRLSIPTMAISPAIRLRLAVAIGAKQLEILEAVVHSIAIDVVQLHVQRPPSPFGNPTEFTAVLFDSLLQMSHLKMSYIFYWSI